MKKIAFAAAFIAVIAAAAAGAAEESGQLTPIQHAALNKATKSVLCACGDCPPTILDDCMCHAARAYRDDMTAQAQKGKTAEQMAAAYIEDHGTQYLAAPAKEGFDLLIWILPAVLFTAGTASLWFFLKSQKETAEETAEETAAQQPSDEYRKRIEKELKERGTV